MSKFKDSIAGKLIFYISFPLLLFSVIVACVFSYLFTKQTTSLRKQELEAKAVSIAGTLTGFMNEGTGHGMGGHNGYGSYLKFLDDVAMTDVWIMDLDSHFITHGHDSMNYSDLPEDAEEVIQEALSGKIAFGEGFSDLLGTQSITVGAPILSSGTVVGVVLLHTPIEGIDIAIASGLGILAISMILALLLAIAAAILLSLKFTKPLRRMKNTALLLADGDYSAQTNITQTDEIGELAKTLDILAKKLYDASKESENLMQMRQDFMANISHELRTPVTVIRGSLEALCDGVVTEPPMVDEYHQQMLLDSLYLERLINDLLDLSRLQNTDFKIECTEINICDVIQDVARSMARISQKKEIPIQVEIEIPPCIILGDYGRIRQMLLIVVDNAVKFSFEKESVVLRLTKENGKTLLHIIDHGAVIPSEELPFIFDRFHKSRDEQNKKGTGLGLAIARQIALRHHIEIFVESQKENTIFHFVLEPLAEHPEYKNKFS